MTLSTLTKQQDETELAPKRLRSLQGAVAALSFSVLLAGSNANTPVVPLYRSLMGFSPFTMSMTFVCYVGVTIIFLIVLSRPSIIRWSPALLGASLLASILSDLCMAVGSEAWTLIGRGLTGVAVGLGTGPAAALVVDAFGIRGRPVSATGNLVGAVFGTALSQLTVYLLDGRLAIRTIFHVHAVVCAVLFVVLFRIFHSMREQNRRAFKPGSAAMPKVYATLSAHWLPLVSGSLAWIAISISITFLPTLFREDGMSLVTSAGMIVLLICCAGCQLGSRYVVRFAPILNGIEALMIGIVCMVAAALSGLQWLGLIGFALTGAGIGISYRLALIVLTRGAPPTIHGVLSSTYAAITYGVAALSVALVGFAGNFFGLEQVVIAVMILIAIVSIALLRNTPRASIER